MPRAQILGTGLYAPERVVPNRYFDDLYGEDVSSFLVANRNIHERRYAAPDQAPSDLAVAAARQALDRAGVAPEDLDLIVVSTDTPDYLSPATASVVQHKLGATNAGTFDLNTACAGFVTALDVASKYVAAEPDQYGRVLVVGTYLMSRFLDFRQRNIA
ncbi:MAG: ketoacyl-ACP synthase III, partial [Bacteroidota bacterium]